MWKSLAVKVFSFEIRPVSAQQASPSCLKRRDSCPASASDICPVSTADVCPVSTAQASVQFCSKQLLATCTLTLVPQLLSAFLQFCFFHTMPELTFSLQRCFFLWRYHTQTSHTLREVFSHWRLEVLEDVDQVDVAGTGDFDSDQETASTVSIADDHPTWYWDDNLGWTINICWMPARRPPTPPPTPP